MGIYLNGMEMPKEIDPSITIEFATGLSGKLYARYHDYNSGSSTEWHKVMTIPEPHGRLIDADAIIKELKEECLRLYATDDLSESPTMSAIAGCLEEAPTIIEAEE